MMSAKFIIAIACLVVAVSSTEMLRRTSGKTIRRPSSTPRPKITTPRATTYNYYMDNDAQCSSLTTHRFHNPSDTASIRAWTGILHSPVLGGCTMTFRSYASDGMQLSLYTSNRHYIDDCSVKLYIYYSSSAWGTPSYTYTCNDLRYTSLRLTTSNNYVTFKLVNTRNTNSFDFTFTVRSHDYGTNGGEIAGICVGVIVFIVIFVTVLSCGIWRRRRYTRGPALIATTTTSATATTTNYNYPTGPAPAPYPPMPPYAPAPYAPAPYAPGPYPTGAPPPAGGMNYQQPPPPPVYS